MEYIILGVLVINIIVSLILIFKVQHTSKTLKDDLEDEIRINKNETINMVQNNIDRINTQSLAMQEKYFELQHKNINAINDGLVDLLTVKQEALNKMIDYKLNVINHDFIEFKEDNNHNLNDIKETVEKNLNNIKDSNEKQLDKMRETVDEKLQKTLDDRITQSFKLVNERLQEVYAGLGEMKNLANGVGDLKKVLSNVKTRGIMGELQLKGILDEILSQDQYEENVVTKKGSSNRVEFAIKLPADDNKIVYLPIDAKFPLDTYHALVDAYELGDPIKIEEAYKALEIRIKQEAKDINEKYIDVPNTTEFGIMFLPFEGLYAEVVRRGLIDTLQRQYKVNIAGPTTIAALLNSLQMGFKTLAIQRRSSEVWDVLGAVKTEFKSFEDVLANAQRHLEQTSSDLEKLVGVRTRQMNRKLSQITELPSDDARKLINQDDVI